MMEALTVREGYARWAGTYDRDDNPLIRLEERAVSRLVAGTPGIVLDAACGTGRHAIRFAQAGALVVGVDDSVEMLAEAKAKARRRGLTGAQFIRGRLDNGLPVRRRVFDMAVCALALCHIRNLRQAVEALCAAVKPGGHLLITDLHPEAVAYGLVTLFSDKGVERAILTERHARMDYVAAIESSGAVVVFEQEMVLGEVFERSPRGLPGTVYERGWRDMPFCLVLVARVS